MIEQDKSFFHRLVSNIDWYLVLAVAILIGISFTAIYSSGSNYGMSFRYLSVQFLAAGIGFVGLLLLTSFNYQYYKHLDKLVYALSFALLVSVLLFGSVKRGTKGWFDFGFISFQPVEIAKIMYILVLSSFLDAKAKESKRVSFLISAFAILFGHLVLIMMQPDFSSTLSYFPITLFLLYAIGVEPFYLLCIVIGGGLAIGIPLLETFFDMQLKIAQNETFLTNLALFLKSGNNVVYIISTVLVLIVSGWWFLWKLRIRIPIIYPVVLCGAIVLGCVSSIFVEKSLKDYQRRRLVVFLDPQVDPRGSGYNIIQSKIAIGSGKFTGKGLKKGTQTQLGFLPEQHTDFIFSVIGEEGGWVIAQLTLIFYFLFIWRALVIAKESRDRYGSLVATGIATMFAFYAVINIGMVMGMMPVTGMPLLLLSYGGSSILSSLCAIGVLCSIHIRRHTY
ncbi:rod shape-determining protein RodA [Candidatus Endomicrobiellum devescovinae]|jgi:rod shape determining protein RodA|uniref:rod shape-determining protein RodA n=1 Tax=Candidatus Endomicrobiellum devescovinae TaxID=3242322 RepID=UPI0028290D10|nr:rod shape-determining protein RodA [Endomicrobium sp.]